MSRRATLRVASPIGTIERADEVISHSDVTTVMGILSSIEGEVKVIRQLLQEEEDAGEETTEDDG